MKDSIKERDRIGVIEADPTKGVGGRDPPTRKKNEIKSQVVHFENLFETATQHEFQKRI